jgi:hypothetical protein
VGKGVAVGVTLGVTVGNWAKVGRTLVGAGVAVRLTVGVSQPALRPINPKINHPPKTQISRCVYFINLHMIPENDQFLAYYSGFLMDCVLMIVK